MSTSTGVNVLRYSALVFGVFYGFSHQRSITSRDKKAADSREYNRQADLIAQAKAKWAEKSAPPESKKSDGGIVTNPEDPNFDLEAYLNKVDADSK
ncbi:MAG: hypothetical protein M1820_003370 [Bogoriella megaspora]|nr:MAG: hypothetical protein M1820_003370 [Bogoriella megaspora]